VLVGLDDVAEGQVRLRDLESGDEEDVTVAELADWFDEWLSSDELGDGDHGHHPGNGNGNPLGGNGGSEQ